MIDCVTMAPPGWTVQTPEPDVKSSCIQVFRSIGVVVRLFTSSGATLLTWMVVESVSVPPQESLTRTLTVFRSNGVAVGSSSANGIEIVPVVFVTS